MTNPVQVSITANIDSGVPQLRRLLDLPKYPISLTLRMDVNKLVELDITFNPDTPAEIDVTSLSSLAVTHALDQNPVTKRYRLEEITEPGPSTAQPD